MRSIVLNQYEKKGLDKLLEIDKNIYNLYIKIANSKAFNNEEDTKKYIDKLKEYITLEEEILDYFYTNDELLEPAMECFISKERINNFNEEINTIYTNNSNDIIIRRIINRLLTRSKEVKSNTLMSFGDEVEYLMGIQSKSLPKSLPKSYGYYGLANLLNLEMSLRKDFFSTLLKLSENTSYLKYTLAYLYDFLEKVLIQTNFTTFGDLYWSFGIVIDQTPFRDGEVENSKKLFGYDLINKLLNSKYRDEDKTNMLIRCALLFCSDEEVEELSKYYPNYNLKENIEEDRSLVNYVSLGGKTYER